MKMPVLIHPYVHIMRVGSLGTGVIIYSDKTIILSQMLLAFSFDKVLESGV